LSGEKGNSEGVTPSGTRELVALRAISTERSGAQLQDIPASPGVHVAE
jgi:hypothetical protein